MPHYILVIKMLYLSSVFVLLCHSSSAFLPPTITTKYTNPSTTLSYSKLFYKNEKATTDEVETAAEATSIVWDNEDATEQVGDLVDILSGSDSKSVDQTEKTGSNADDIKAYIDDMPPTLPAQTIIHKNNHVIFRPALQENLIANPVMETSTSQPLRLQQQTAVVFLPGCFLEPMQYEALALAIQEQSTHPVWVVVPKLFLNAANPWSAPRAVKESVNALHTLGYPSDSKVFLGGHSLGGHFLPHILDKLEPNDRKNIAGKIQLGSFVGRDQREDEDAAYRSMPRLTVAGDLDGLIRSSRIAEDIEHHVLGPIADAGQDEDQARMDHSVVLIPGMVRYMMRDILLLVYDVPNISKLTRLLISYAYMYYQNHFQLVETNAAHMFCEKRDLAAEISKDEAIQATASVITEFMEVHQVNDDNKERKESLLQKIKSTEAYVQPLLDAMKLEGNYNLRTPCNLIEECDCDDCNKGSSWVESIQQKLLPENVQAEEIADEFRRTWYINPFADPPFYHPHVDQSSNGDNKVNIGTVTEGVYEKQDYFFDGGFFSNTAVELRSKLNSPQAIMDALDVPIPFEAGCNTCSKMNEMTINWALDHAPEIVKKRYKERGIKLQAGVDISHNNGRK